MTNQPEYQNQMPPTTQYPPTQPAVQKTNTFAIVSLIAAFFASILGIIFGHIALSQIKKTGENGRGLALAGTILGYVFTFGWIIVMIVMLAAGALFSAVSTTAISELQDGQQSLVVEDEDQDETEEFIDSDETFGDELEDGFDDEFDDTVFDDDFLGQMPWAGTDRAEFCDMFMQSEMMEDDPAGFLTELAQKAPNEETADAYKKLADSVSEAGINDLSAFEDMYMEVIEQFSKDLDYCAQG